MISCWVGVTTAGGVAGRVTGGVFAAGAVVTAATRGASLRSIDLAFLAMGGYGLYVWGSLGMCAAVGSCRIGSVKTNIGHLDTAAGVASLIKVALQLHHRKLAPSLGYEAPNPTIDFESSPFRVNNRLTDWQALKVC